MLIIISVTSAGYTYLADQDGWKSPQTMNWSDQLLVWPTAFTVQITHDRARADLLAFIFWFVAQAVLLLCLYVVGDYIVSRPKPDGKDL